MPTTQGVPMPNNHKSTPPFTPRESAANYIDACTSIKKANEGIAQLEFDNAAYVISSKLLDDLDRHHFETNHPEQSRDILYEALQQAFNDHLYGLERLEYLLEQTSKEGIDADSTVLIDKAIADIKQAIPKKSFHIPLPRELRIQLHMFLMKALEVIFIVAGYAVLLVAIYWIYVYLAP